MTLTATLRNNGQENAQEGFQVGFYLSSDATIDGSDIQVGNGYVGYFAAGTEQIVNAIVRIPASVAASGTYYIGAIADIANAVQDESDENNNAAAGNTIAITKGYPDLMIEAVSGPSSGQTEQNVTLTATVRNQGQESAQEGFYIGFYLSSDTTIDGSDIQVGNGYVGYFAAGTEQTVSANVLLPTSIAVSGTYYIGAIADISTSVQDESDENNNAAVGNMIAVTKM